MKIGAAVFMIFAVMMGSQEAGAEEIMVPSDPDYPSESVTGRHTFTLGYAQSHIKHLNNIKGINFKYHYEIPVLPLSGIVSMTWMNGRDTQSEDFGTHSEEEHHRVRYYSLMLGPAYRVTHWASLYLLAGAGWESSNNKHVYYDASGEHSGRYKIFDARFAWGTGVQFNVMDKLALDVGYQAGHVQKTSSNGFNIGVGYRF